MNLALRLALYTKTIACTLVLGTFLFGVASLHAQLRHLPLSTACRKSLVTRSYVLQMQNDSLAPLNIWLAAKGRMATYKLAPKGGKEIGWVQGFHFDADNSFMIGSEGFDTLKQHMPNEELAPWRIGWSKNDGLNISFAKTYLQEQIARATKLPLKRELASKPILADSRILKSRSNSF